MTYFSARDIVVPPTVLAGEPLTVSSEQRRTLTIVGAPNRGRVKSVEAVPSGEAIKATDVKAVLSDHKIELSIRPHPAEGLTGEALRIVTSGEGFELVAMILDTGSGPTVEVYLAEGDCKVGDEPVTMPRAEARTLADPARVGTELQAHFKRSGQSPKTRYQRFFALMDQSTHPDLLGVRNKPSEYVQLLKAYFWQMVQSRSLAASTGDPAPIYEAVSDDSPDAFNARELLDSMRRMLEELWATDPHAVDEAFEAFANGELRVRLPCRVWTTQPSSALYFCFAELALYAIDQGEQGALGQAQHLPAWYAFARIFVRTQQIYVDAYAPCTPEPVRFGDYNGCCYPGRPWQRTEVLALRKRFAHASAGVLRHAAGTHAALAFPGGFEL